MRVEALAHVHLDRQRLAAGDQAAAGHQDCAHEADRQDGADEDPEHLVVVRGERLVDHGPGQPDERDRGALGEHREHDRDGQRELVRAQESQQPGERLAITGSLLHPRNLAIHRVATDPRELAVDELHGGLCPFPVRLVVRPRARAGRVRERDRDGAVGTGTTLPMQPRGRSMPSSCLMASVPTGTISAGRISRSSHSRQKAQSSCSRRRRLPVAALRVLARVAARDRGAVEGRVELVLVELEPAAQRSAGAAAPRAALLALDDARGLAEHVRALARRTAGRSAATRAGSRPRRRRGRRGCRVAARRASGSASGAASRADGDEPAAGEDGLAAAELARRARRARSSACRPPSASRRSGPAPAAPRARRPRAGPSRRRRARAPAGAPRRGSAHGRRPRGGRRSAR